MEALPNSGACDIFLRIWINDKYANLETVHLQRYQREEGFPLR